MPTFNQLIQFYQVSKLDLATLLGFMMHREPMELLVFPYEEYFFHPRDIRKLERLSNGEPVSKIIKHKGFWKYDFIVNSHVLDPRPESEILIEAALRYKKPTLKSIDVGDLGCGSGNLLFSYLLDCPHAKGWGIDISESALRVAKRNAKRLEISHRVSLIQSYWGRHIHRSFDLIFCNPPYLRFNEGDSSIRYDPSIALYSDSTGLSAYRDVFQILPNLLKKNGIAIFEMSCYLVKEIVNIVPHTFTILEVIKDYSGHSRVLVLSHAKTNTKETF